MPTTYTDHNRLLPFRKHTVDQMFISKKDSSAFSLFHRQINAKTIGPALLHIINIMLNVLLNAEYFPHQRNTAISPIIASIFFNNNPHF